MIEREDVCNPRLVIDNLGLMKSMEKSKCWALVRRVEGGQQTNPIAVFSTTQNDRSLAWRSANEYLQSIGFPPEFAHIEWDNDGEFEAYSLDLFNELTLSQVDIDSPDYLSGLYDHYPIQDYKNHKKLKEFKDIMKKFGYKLWNNQSKSYRFQLEREDRFSTKPSIVCIDFGSGVINIGSRENKHLFNVIPNRVLFSYMKFNLLQC